jgi:chromosome segregation ATPase
MALTREFLKGLGIEGLTDDHLQKIMDEHGETITTNKRTWEETKKTLEGKIAALETRADVTPADLEALQTSLKDAEKKLKAYEGVDVDALKRQLAEAQDKVTTLEAEHQAKVAELEADSLLREQIAKITFSSDYARKGVYEDLKGRVKYEAGEDGKPGRLTGFDEAIEEIREKQPAAFGTDTSKNDPPPKDEGKKHNTGGKGEKPKEVPLLI